MPAHTFAKLPVRVLINDPQKKLIQTSTTTHVPFFDEPQIWPTFIFLHHQFLNLPLHTLIHDLQKKNLWASTRTHDTFFDNSEIWHTFIYRGEVPVDTFAKLPVRVLINDPKKFFQKKCMLPFPNDLKHFQMCPTFDLAEIGQNVG